MTVHLDNIYLKFGCQSNNIKVKVTLINYNIPTVWTTNSFAISGRSRISHWGGCRPVGGTDPPCIHFLAKTCAKMKEMDPVGGHMLAAPPGSANGYDRCNLSFVHICYHPVKDYSIYLTFYIIEFSIKIILIYNLSLYICWIIYLRIALVTHERLQRCGMYDCQIPSEGIFSCRLYILFGVSRSCAGPRDPIYHHLPPYAL